MSKIRGALSTKDKKYIEDNKDKLSVEHIAEVLKRGTATIEKHITSILAKEKKAEISGEDLDIIKSELQQESFWPSIIKQFTKDECEVFKDDYARTLSQFRQTAVVLHTEKMQVVDLIRTSLLRDRALERQKNAIDMVEEIEREISDHIKNNPVNKDQELLRTLNRTKVEINQTFNNYSREYKDLQGEVNKLKSDLNASRGARVQNIQDAKTNFASAIMLLDKENKRQKEGEFINIFRMSIEKELKRLSDYYEFFDGEVDQPILSAETLKEDNE